MVFLGSPPLGFETTFYGFLSLFVLWVAAVVLNSFVAALGCKVVVLFSVAVLAILVLTFEAGGPLGFILFGTFANIYLLLVLCLAEGFAKVGLLVGRCAIFLSTMFNVPTMVIFLVLGFLFLV